MNGELCQCIWLLRELNIIMCFQIFLFIRKRLTFITRVFFFSQNIWYIEGYCALYMTPFAMRQPGNMLLKAGTMFFHLKMILLAALA